MMGLHFHIVVQRECILTTFAMRNTFQQMHVLTCFVSIEQSSKGKKNDHVKTRLQEQTFFTIAPVNSFPLRLGEKHLVWKKIKFWKNWAFAWALVGKLLSWTCFSFQLHSTVFWASGQFFLIVQLRQALKACMPEPMVANKLLPTPKC